MYKTEAFEFTSAAPSRADVTLDERTQTKEELLRQLARSLSFPEYFGYNWDALIDCLGDLTWHRAPEVIIDHAGVPSLPLSDLRLYLESLIDGANRRTPDRQPRLRILFRVQDRDLIATSLAR